MIEQLKFFKSKGLQSLDDIVKFIDSNKTKAKSSYEKSYNTSSTKAKDTAVSNNFEETQ